MLLPWKLDFLFIQVCGAGSQLPASKKVLDPAPASKRFWLWFQDGLIQQKLKNQHIIM